MSQTGLPNLIDSLLPDFALAFVFFTSLVYAILGRRFDKQRPAVAASVSMGLSLAVGLVWWEQANGYSIKDLGPLAVGFAVILLAFVMYQSIKQVGGSWAGAGITIAATVLIAGILGFDAPVDGETIQTVTVAALVIGALAFMSHYNHSAPNRTFAGPRLPGTRRTMTQLYRQRHLSKDLDNGLRRVRKEARTLRERPQDAGDIMVQIKRMLPAQGYLTERMAGLRAKAHQIRNGHIARLEETRQAFAKLPPSASKRAAEVLADRYRQMVGIETRMERLDRAVAENEKRIRELTGSAQRYAAGYDHKRLYQSLNAAEKLQHHNSRLFKIIERTEAKLSAVARQTAREVKEFEHAKQ